MKSTLGKPSIKVWMCILVLGLLTLTRTMAAQNHYYVSAGSGSDSNDGSQSHPWKTIQHANSALSLGAGGTLVHVQPGTYSGPITTTKAGTSTARIAFVSDVKWGAKIITPNWDVRAPYIDIKGFDMSSPTYTWGIAIESADASVAHDLHVMGNYMHDMMIAPNNCPPVSPIYIGGEGKSHDNWIIGNVIRHIGNPNGHPCNDIHGIYEQGTRDILQNNVISGTAGWGIQVRATSGHMTISNNTIVDCNGGIVLDESDNDGEPGIAGIMDYMTINNNIIINSTGGTGGSSGSYGLNFYHSSGTHWVVNNNLIYGNLPANYAHHSSACTAGTPMGNDSGCPSSNPKSDRSAAATFVNYQRDTNTSPTTNYDPANYQLKAGSAAIQGGSSSCATSPGPTPCIPSTDIIGVARLSSALDIGAFEQGSSVAGVPSAPTGLTAVVR